MLGNVSKVDFINTESDWIDNLCMDENITVVENSENSENLDDTVSAELFPVCGCIIMGRDRYR